MRNYPAFLGTWEHVSDAEYACSLWEDTFRVVRAVEAASVWASENLLTVVPAEYRHSNPLTFSLSECL